METPRVVLSVSGGMDSTSLLLSYLSQGYECFCLSFDYGQKHKLELERFNSNYVDLRSKGLSVNWEIIDLHQLGGIFESALTSPGIEIPEGHYEDENMKMTVVPNRNAIFSSIIYGYALSLAKKFKQEVTISLGVHAGDHQIYPDCRPEFYRAIEKAFQLGNWDSELIKMEFPYLYLNKTSILKNAILSIHQINQFLFDFDNILPVNFNTVFKNTNTCYNPDKEGRSCGVCGSCTERLEAFKELESVDPVEYKNI